MLLNHYSAIAQAAIPLTKGGFGPSVSFLNGRYSNIKLYGVTILITIAALVNLAINIINHGLQPNWLNRLKRYAI